MAARYWVGGTANWDNTAGTKWSTTSGGAGGAAVPTSADDVFFDANSGVVTVTVTAAANCLSLNCTGFAGTLAGSSTINVFAGGCTFDAGMTITHSGNLAPNDSGTYTSNGKTWTGNFTIIGSLDTITFADNWDVDGNFSTINTNSIAGSFTMTVGGSFTWAAITSNTMNFTLDGTGNFGGTSTWSGTGTITINTAGTYTCNALITLAGSAVLVYTAGTVITTGNTIVITGSVTLNISGVNWNNASMTGVITVTLSSNLTLLGNLSVGSLGQTTTINGNTINVGGNFTVAGTTSIITGTTNLVLNGTGNWTNTTQTTTGRLTLNVTINTAGTITLVGSNHRYRTGTITYTAGTVIPGTSVFTFEAATTLNTFGMTWYSMVFGGTTTITNNSRLIVTNDLTYASGSVITFAGTEGWTAKNFYILTSNNVSHVLVATKEYIVTTYFESITTTSSLKDSLISDTPGTKAIFTLNYSATQNVGFTNATDIDSSRGQTIWTWNGVVTTTLNWNVFTSNSANQTNFIF